MSQRRASASRSRGWETLGAEALADPAAREAIAAKYPGSGKLLGGAGPARQPRGAGVPRRRPVPGVAGRPAGANVSVLVSQPSVGGLLLDFVAGFIADALTDVLGATADPAQRAGAAAGG